jgi:hypothetical protein
MKKEISIYNYRCGGCELEFPSPYLGDFSYGEFILWSQSGRYCVYFDAIESADFSSIEDLIECAGKGGENMADLVQLVLGGVMCDPAPDGTRYSVYGFPACPFCGSVSGHSIMGTCSSGVGMIDRAMFSIWHSMSIPEKKNAIKMFFLEGKNSCGNENF